MERSNRFLSLVRFEWISGPSWAKKGCFGAQNAREGTSLRGTTALGCHR